MRRDKLLKWLDNRGSNLIRDSIPSPSFQTKYGARNNHVHITNNFRVGRSDRAVYCTLFRGAQ
jgi:hypothetical protein